MSKSNQTSKGHNYQNHDILNWLFYIPVGISFIEQLLFKNSFLDISSGFYLH